MGFEVVEHPPLDEHEACSPVPHLDAPGLVGLGVACTDHIEHERPAVVLKVRLACERSALHAVPVDLLLRVDTTGYVLISRYKLEDCVAFEADICVDKHQVVMLTL